MFFTKITFSCVHGQFINTELPNFKTTLIDERELPIYMVSNPFIVKIRIGPFPQKIKIYTNKKRNHHLAASLLCIMRLPHFNNSLGSRLASSTLCRLHHTLRPTPCHGQAQWRDRNECLDFRPEGLLQNQGRVGRSPMGNPYMIPILRGYLWVNKMDVDDYHFIVENHIFRPDCRVLTGKYLRIS